MYTLLAFDPASVKNLGWCVAQYRREKFSIIKSNTLVFNDEDSIDSIGRLLAGAKYINSLLETYKPDIVLLENSVGHGFAPTRANLNELVGVIKYICGLNFKRSCVTISPSHWKKVVSGSGKSKSHQVKKFLSEILDINIKTLHESDAIAIVLTYCIDNFGLIWEHKIEKK